MAPRTPRSPVAIASASQMAALVSPIRQEIVDAVSAAGPSTMAQIAEWLGRPADTLYYHVTALRRVGLLVDAGRRRTGRRFGSVYDVPGRPLLMRPQGEKAPQMIQHVVRAALRLADRDLRRSLAVRQRDGAARSAPGGEAPAPRFEGKGRNVWAGRTKGWVDQADLARIAALMDQLVAIVGHGKPRPGAHAQAFTFVLAPVVSRPARRERTASGDSSPNSSSDSAPSSSPSSSPRSSSPRRAADRGRRSVASKQKGTRR